MLARQYAVVTVGVSNACTAQRLVRRRGRKTGAASRVAMCCQHGRPLPGRGQPECFGQAVHSSLAVNIAGAGATGLGRRKRFSYSATFSSELFSSAGRPHGVRPRSRTVDWPVCVLPASIRAAGQQNTNWHVQRRAAIEASGGDLCRSWRYRRFASAQWALTINSDRVGDDFSREGRNRACRSLTHGRLPSSTACVIEFLRHRRRFNSRATRFAMSLRCTVTGAQTG